MNTKQTDQKPLWKVLNEQRTQGEWIAKGEGGTQDGGSTKQHPCFNGSITAGRQAIVQQSTLIGMQGKTPKEAEANAQYTALCVNNFAAVVEALGNMMDEIEKKLPIGSNPELYELFQKCQQAKEALKAIQ